MRAAWRLAFFELRRFRTPTQRIALGLLVALPVLFGVAYLGSTWDPASRLDRVPVAVVNADRPVTVDDVTVDGGTRLVESLTATDTFDWEVTDADTAAAGLASGRYYLTITVPADFSAKLASGPDRPPRRPTVVVRRDDANGYGVAALTDRVRADLKQHVDRAATTAYYESVFGDVDSLHSNVQSAREAAETLRGSIDEAGNGSAELALSLADTATASGEVGRRIGKLREDSQSWVDRATEVADTSAELVYEDTELTDSVLPVIPEVADSAGQVADLAAALDDYPLADQTARVRDQLTELAVDHPELADDPAYVAVLDTAEVAAADADSATQLFEELNDAATDLATTTTELSSDAAELSDALEDRRDLDSLAATASEVAEGAATVGEELGAIGDRVKETTGSLKTAAKDARRLNDTFQGFRGDADTAVSHLSSITDRLPALSKEQRVTDAAILGSPAKLRTVADHDARVDGRGVAPFLFAIALFVLGVLAYLLIRPVTGRALAGRIGPWPITLAGWLPAFAVTVTGGLALLLISLLLGLAPANLLASLGVLVVGAATFTAIAQLLRTWFGGIGTLVAAGLLLLQVVAAAPVYPQQTLPRVLELVHPVLPMTHAVDALRIAFTGGAADRLWVALAVLSGFGVAAFIGTAGVVMAYRRWTPRRLRPVFTWPEPARG